MVECSTLCSRKRRQVCGMNGEELKTTYYCVAPAGGTNISTNRRKRKRVQESSRVPASPDLGISANQIPVMVSFQWRRSTQKLWQLVMHGSCCRTGFATGGQHCCITKEMQTCSQQYCLLLMKRLISMAKVALFTKKALRPSTFCFESV